jgi:hypothetical protein
VLEENEGQMCSSLEETEVLVVEKRFLLRVDARTGLIIVYPWRFDGESVKEGAMAMAR